MDASRLPWSRTPQTNSIPPSANTKNEMSDSEMLGAVLGGGIAPVFKKQEITSKDIPINTIARVFMREVLIVYLNVKQITQCRANDRLSESEFSSKYVQ